MEKIRSTAKKIRITDIVNGKYFQGFKDQMKPSYIITPFGQKVSRANIVATVTDKFLSDDGNYSSVTIDDGTESIKAKAFKDDAKLVKDLEPGNLVLVIGKIKEYNGEVYINGEIAKKLEDFNYENFRKLEILKSIPQQKKIVDEIRGLLNQLTPEELEDYVNEKFGIDQECLQVIVENLNVMREIDYKPKVLELIKSLDEGNGVEIGKIFELSSLPENIIEKTMDDLIVDGSLFEPRVGILKIVE